LAFSIFVSHFIASISSFLKASILQFQILGLDFFKGLKHLLSEDSVFVRDSSKFSFTLLYFELKSGMNSSQSSVNSSASKRGSLVMDDGSGAFDSFKIKSLFLQKCSRSSEKLISFQLLTLSLLLSTEGDM
jgi:hypothetical protein